MLQLEKLGNPRNLYMGNDKWILSDNLWRTFSSDAHGNEIFCLIGILNKNTHLQSKFVIT